MNPLTQVKNIQKATARETAAGISEQGSWHERYKDSAYINIGLLPFDLTEGDLLAIFAQYGEVVDVNLVRDKGTGKSRGFAFLAYEDQRSTVLAVDNLNGARVVGRTIRVDHVANYKKKIEEDEEEEQRKREERGVCYAFQRGECNRGAACKFSHDLERNSNSGWGKKEDGPTWGRQRNGQSPPPPPWKQSNGPKDNPPPWRRGSGQRDDAAPSRKENGSNYVSQTRDDNDRQKSDQLAQRHDDLTRDAGPPSSSRQRTSQIDDIPARGGDSSGLGRLSRRYDDSEDDHLLSREGDSTRRDVSPDARRHRNRRDEQYSSYKEREGDVLPRRSARRDDSSLRRRYDTQSEDDSSPKRRHEKRRSNTEDSFSLAQRSGKSRDDSHPTRRHDSRSEDDSSPKRKLAKRSARDDSAFARRGHVQDDTQLSDEDPGAPRNGNTKDWSPRQRSDKYSKDGNFSPKRRYERTEDTERSPRMTHTTSGTSRKGNPK